MKMDIGIKRVNIAVSIALLDAGESTRALELAKGIKEYVPDGYSVHITFLSNGGKFKQKILDSGFEIQKISPRLEGIGFFHDLKPGAHDFVGDPGLTAALLDGEIRALREYRPDIVLHGFWPFASLARRMVSPRIPGVCFLPLPLEEGIYCSDLMKDVPDQIKPLTFLPEGFRRALMKVLPASLKLRAPILRQKNLLDAARKCGWSGPELGNLFDMMKADITVVNDLPLFYQGMRIPSDFHIAGPLYSQPESGDEPDPEILRVFGEESDGKTKIFCSLGSSGMKAALLEAAKAIASLPEERFAAVILVPRAVCPMEEVRPYVVGKRNLYITDRFVPAKLVNKLADLVVSHGGQGTVQTAISCGTPIVGFAVQPEQQINLDNIVLRGACIRIPITRWKERNIRNAVVKVAGDTSYKRNAERLAENMEQSNGREESARIIWNFIVDTRSGQKVITDEQG